ncbi:hypothetical protein DB88DRAFT_298001 [Papiliotrema laurentii]|uniref:Uncharacterized protein n=1 Tax=Papiliotrema laurentii TaxID=5418 RepID=A0AAD9CXQ0_PAPLA|nr:hypothetical protein DB88DRAFT_298001 [Papiliotrema laurentii]
MTHSNPTVTFAPDVTRPTVSGSTDSAGRHRTKSESKVRSSDCEHDRSRSRSRTFAARSPSQASLETSSIVVDRSTPIATIEKHRSWINRRRLLSPPPAAYTARNPHVQEMSNPPYCTHWRDYYPAPPLGPDVVLPKPPHGIRLYSSKWQAENLPRQIRDRERKERYEAMQRHFLGMGGGMMGRGPYPGMGMGMMGMMGYGVSNTAPDPVVRTADGRCPWVWVLDTGMSSRSLISIQRAFIRLIKQELDVGRYGTVWGRRFLVVTRTSAVLPRHSRSRRGWVTVSTG